LAAWEKDKLGAVAAKLFDSKKLDTGDPDNVIALADVALTFAPKNLPASIVKALAQYRKKDYHAFRDTVNGVDEPPETSEERKQLPSINALKALAQARSTEAAEQTQAAQRIGVLTQESTTPYQNELGAALADLAAANPSLAPQALKSLKNAVAHVPGDKKAEIKRLASSTFTKLLAYVGELR